MDGVQGVGQHPVVEHRLRDVDRLERRDAGTEQRRQGGREPRHRLLAEEIPEDRQAQLELVPQQAALARVDDQLEDNGHDEGAHQHEQPVIGDELADADQDLRREGELLAAAAQQLGDLRDDDRHEDRDHDDADDDHDRRVDHRGADLVLDPGLVLQEPGQSHHHLVEGTRRLAGLDHVGVEVREVRRVLHDRVAEREPLGDLLADVAERRLDLGVGGLLDHHPQGFGQRDACPQQRRHLPRDLGDLLISEFVRKLDPGDAPDRELAVAAAALLADVRDVDVDLVAQLDPRVARGVRIDHPLDRLVAGVDGLVFEDGHLDATRCRAG